MRASNSTILWPVISKRLTPGTGDPNRSERGELFAKVRLEELQARGDRVKARGNARGPHAGATFELVDHPRPDQNREVLVVRGDYRMYQPGFDAGSSTGEDQGEDEPVFETRLLVQPAKTTISPATNHAAALHLRPSCRRQW